MKDLRLTVLSLAALGLLLAGCRKDAEEPDPLDELAATPMNGWEVWTTAENIWMAGASPNALFRSFQQSAPQARFLERSIDGGGTWTRWGTSLLVSPHFHTDAVGFSHFNAVVHRTANAGQSWEPLPAEITRVFAFHNVPQRVFARVDTLTHVSEDGGASWTSLGAAGPQGALVGMHFPSPDTGYATTAQGVWRSTDAGATWSLLAPGVRAGWLGHRDVQRGVVNYGVSVNGILQNCLARTNDGWATWDTLIMPPVTALMNMALNDPSGYLYGYSLNTVYRSADTGQNWDADFQCPQVIHGIFRYGDRLYTWSDHNWMSKHAPL